MNLLNFLASRIKILKDVQVLVIDNDRDTLDLYAVLLEGHGRNVVTCTSIREALEVLDWLLPDILLCEMRFYGESINTLITKLNQIENNAGNHIPAIAVTTWVTDSLAQILEEGFEGYLLKPIDLDALVSMIENLLLLNRSRSSYMLPT